MAGSCTRALADFACASKWQDIGARAGARAQRYLARPPFAPARALKGMRPLDPYSRPRKVDVRLIPAPSPWTRFPRSEEHTSELQSLTNLVCRLLLEKKNT